MVISDLQYLESVETSSLVGGWKRPKFKKGGYGKLDIDVNVAIVTINQTAVNFGKGTISQSASVDIDQ